ncbi:maleylpyruvate isomerase N-terminal domain-containing protein [Fulvivirga sedimenti]|uniref:Maleylpyruvate isomerase N-terminal domain-containing protein n=1 Tax=Fulvivirga sedimenti TaxID=2879465 RepID=A0A9X1L2A2_9BACT|nr:maleylpyruvate isomerase N-terminal domain-containing protein [Fulvivirga sedimenti]MCA6079082.1 maleylpyruvate isomerase N-terminal domain-containing protein [Fulvivirga sedimenti]
MYFSSPQLDTRPYFATLHDNLIRLLEDLAGDEWQTPTVASKWRVKDVVAHLLDGDIRTLSVQRDLHFGEKPPESNDFGTVVQWLNELNASWVHAAKRMSPEVLIMLHKTTGPVVTEYYESLDPMAEAIFSVQWAGEEKSLNWMHLSREYSEKWHHQQQIADATGRRGVLTPELYRPLIMTFMLGIPHTLRDTSLKSGDTIILQTTGAVEEAWILQYQDSSWQFSSTAGRIRTEVRLPSNAAWKLFSKSLRPAHLNDNLVITGEKNIGEKIINMISVMA